METTSKRVLLVENDGGVVRAVRAAIEEDPVLRFIGHLVSRANLEAFLDEHAPDVALVDIGLMRPGEGMQVDRETEHFEEGLWVIERINELSPHTKIIGFSKYFTIQPQLAKRALDCGADAIIAKQSGPSDPQTWSQWLRYEITAVVGNWWRLSPAVAHLLSEEEEERQHLDPDAPLPLTPRQMQVLRLLASGLSDAEIAAALVIEEGAVRGHIANIKRRLQRRYRWQVVEDARRHGIGGTALAA